MFRLAAARTVAGSSKMAGMSAVDPNQTDTEIQRPPVGALRWRCRRGMRELDVLLERYLQQRYPTASPAEQRAFIELLDCPDPQLFGFVTGREVPATPEWAHVIARLVAAEG